MSNTSKIQPRDIVLEVIGQCSSREEFGRTSLQKVSYLTSLILDVDLGHRAYYYGPFSSIVDADADALVLGALVTETVEPLGRNNRGFPVTKHRYQITEHGNKRLARLEKAHPQQAETVQKFIARLQEVVGSLEQKTLSAISKILYISREQTQPLSAQEMKKLAADMGWKLSERTIEQVTQMLNDLNLVAAGHDPATTDRKRESGQLADY